MQRLAFSDLLHDHLSHQSYFKPPNNIDDDKHRHGKERKDAPNIFFYLATRSRWHDHCAHDFA